MHELWPLGMAVLVPYCHHISTDWSYLCISSRDDRCCRDLLEEQGAFPCLSPFGFSCASAGCTFIVFSFSVIRDAFRSQKKHYGIGVCPQCGEKLQDKLTEAMPIGEAAIVDANTLEDTFGLTAPLSCPICKRISHLNCTTAGHKSKGGAQWKAICPACSYEIGSVEIKGMHPRVYMYGFASDRDYPE